MTPIVSGDKILISAPYYRVGSVCLRVLEDGKRVEEVWRGQQLEMHWARPIMVDGYLYGFSGRNEPDAVFVCVEFATGKVMWSRDEAFSKSRAGGKPTVFGRGSGIVADGKHFVLGEGGLLGLFIPDPAKLREIARYQIPDLHLPTWAGPVLADGRLYLRGEERLVCLDIQKNRTP
jgi:hypothetical protein